VLLPRNAGLTGTSQRPNSKQHGSKARRNCFIRTAKRMPRLSVNRINQRSDVRGRRSERRTEKQSTRMNLKLKAIVVPALDVDRAKKF